MDATDDLISIEHELAAGDGSAYRKHLRKDAVVIVPGATLDKEATIAAIDAEGDWDEFAIEGETGLRLGSDAAVVTYRFRGRRGDFRYSAQLASAYAREGERWLLVLHQQTPIEDGGAEPSS
jgi:hypothetical protein